MTGDLTRLYHPRTDLWTAHFYWNGPEVTARTAVARVTLAVLGINEPDFVEVRIALILEGVPVLE